jgi:hypothetical protein
MIGEAGRCGYWRREPSRELIKMGDRATCHENVPSAGECDSETLFLTCILVLRSIDSLTYGEALPRRGKL